MRRWITLTVLGAALGCQGGRAARPAPDAGPAVDTRPKTRDPDYPTPAMAGTDSLFLVEEPVRGPHVTSVTLPDRTGLKFTDYTYCELGAIRLACAGKVREGQARWNVGRKNGDVVLAEEITPQGRVSQTLAFDYDRNGKLTRIVSLEEHGLLDWARTFNPPGERYMERSLSGANQLLGCGAMAVKHDGKTKTLECLQWNGSPMRDTNGAFATLVRSEEGFVVEAQRLGANRKPQAGNDGVHRIVTQRDPAGRPLAQLFYDLGGKLVISSQLGCAGKRWEYDERGVTAREICLGPDGEPAGSEVGVAVTLITSDSDGCTIGKTYLDRDGRPTHVRGVHGVLLEVDRYCDERVKTCIDDEGRPTACGPEEPARYEYARDEKGRILSVKHREDDGQPGRDPEYGVFEVRKEYDALGNLVEETCWGASGEPTECDHTGYHAEKVTVDDAGRPREVRYFDSDGTATTNLGVAKRRYVYDNYDHLHQIDGFGADGDVVDSMGMATQRRLYDAGHHLFALILFDRSGQPAHYTGCFTGRDCPTRDWHAVRIVRGPNGRAIKNQFFDAGGQLIETIDCDSKRCWQ